MAKRRHNPDTNTTLIALGVIGGLAAVYFLTKSNNSSRAGLIGDGTGTPDTPDTPVGPDKTAAYGADAIKSYQQFMRQVYTTLRDAYFTNEPAFFATIGISDPGPADGVWGGVTERASRGFLSLGQKGLEYAKLSAAAMAAQDAASSARLSPNAYPFHLIPQFAVFADGGEAAVIERMKRMRDKDGYISQADFWALYGGTGFLNRPNMRPWPFEHISTVASNPG